MTGQSSWSGHGHAQHKLPLKSKILSSSHRGAGSEKSSLMPTHFCVWLFGYSPQSATQWLLVCSGLCSGPGIIDCIALRCICKSLLRQGRRERSGKRTVDSGVYTNNGLRSKDVPRTSYQTYRVLQTYLRSTQRYPLRVTRGGDLRFCPGPSCKLYHLDCHTTRFTTVNGCWLLTTIATHALAVHLALHSPVSSLCLSSRILRPTPVTSNGPSIAPVALSPYPPCPRSQ